MKREGDGTDGQRLSARLVAVLLVVMLCSTTANIAAGEPGGGSRIHASVSSARPRTICEYHTLTHSEPADITRGPDGALWFTESGANAIGRMTTGGAYSEFLLRNTDPLPNDIARGPDGALWFTEYNGNAIGRITTKGMITEYRVPTRASVPFAITAGPDHAMWFTESRGSKIGRITMKGKIHEYRLPRPDHGDLFGIAAGPDHALWFTESSDDRLGRITTKGKITEYQVPTPDGVPSGVTAGPDHAIWFAEQHHDGFGIDGNNSNTIGRIATTPKPGAPQPCIKRSSHKTRS